MSLSAALVYCDFLDGSILKAAEKSREVIFRLRNTGASHWPLGVTLKPSEGTDRISCTAKALAESVACAQEADLRVSLDLSGANAGHHVLWFDLHCPEASFSSSGLSRVFIEFLLRPARRLVAQVFEFRPAPEQKYSFHCRGTRLSQKAEELLLIRAPFVSIIAVADQGSPSVDISGLVKADRPVLRLFKDVAGRLPSARSFDDQLGTRVYWHLTLPGQQGIAANAVYSYQAPKNVSFHRLEGLFVYNPAIVRLQPRPATRTDCQACACDGDVIRCSCGRTWHPRCLVTPAPDDRGADWRCPDCHEEQRFLQQAQQQPKALPAVLTSPVQPLALSDDFWHEVLSSPPERPGVPDLEPEPAQAPVVAAPPAAAEPRGVDPQLIQTTKRPRAGGENMDPQRKIAKSQAPPGPALA